MSAILLTLTACVAAVQGVATGYQHQAYNQVNPVQKNYDYSMMNNRGYPAKNNYYNNHYNMNTQPTSANGRNYMYDYRSNAKNSAMAYNNQYNMNTQPTSTNGRNYGNQNSAMAYLPFMMGGLEANELATYSMMMNSGSNNVVPYLMMNGENTGLMRMLALNRAGRGGRQLNPYTMALFFGAEL